MKRPERKEEETEDLPTTSKRKRIENNGKFLGEVIKDAELEEIDWDKYREERKLEMEREEKARMERIEKAERLSKAWDLSRECRKFLRENATAWIDHEHEMEKRRKEEKKQEQRNKAKAEKEKFKEDYNRKTRMRTIREMLSQIPRVEAEKIENDVRRDERKELSEMKQNIWKKWRGKNRIIENKTKMNDNDRIDRRILEIQKKLEEYRKRKEDKLKKQDAKKKKWKEDHKMIVEDHWEMLRWCQQYIEENQCAWARRKEQKNIEELRKKEEEENWKGRLKKYKEPEKEDKLEKARKKQGYWKEWRIAGVENETEKLEIDNLDVIIDAQVPCTKEVKIIEEGRKKQAVEMREKRKAWQREKLEKVKVRNLEGSEGARNKIPQLDSVVLHPLHSAGGREDEEGLEGIEPGAGLCMQCVLIPCICILTVLEDRISRISRLRSEAHNPGPEAPSPPANTPLNKPQSDKPPQTLPSPQGSPTQHQGTPHTASPRTPPQPAEESATPRVDPPAETLQQILLPPLPPSLSSPTIHQVTPHTAGLGTPSQPAELVPSVTDPPAEEPPELFPSLTPSLLGSNMPVGTIPRVPQSNTPPSLNVSKSRPRNSPSTNTGTTPKGSPSIITMRAENILPKAHSTENHSQAQPTEHPPLSEARTEAGLEQQDSMGVLEE